jgi:hypothetical protein
MLRVSFTSDYTFLPFAKAFSDLWRHMRCLLAIYRTCGATYSATEGTLRNLRRHMRRVLALYTDLWRHVWRLKEPSPVVFRRGGRRRLDHSGMRLFLMLRRS